MPRLPEIESSIFDKAMKNGACPYCRVKFGDTWEEPEGGNHSRDTHLFYIRCMNCDKFFALEVGDISNECDES